MRKILFVTDVVELDSVYKLRLSPVNFACW